MNPLSLSQHVDEIPSHRRVFIIGTTRKLPGRRSKKLPKYLDAEITIGDAAGAVVELFYRYKLTDKQAYTIRMADTYGSVDNTAGASVNTLRSLVKRGILVPEISDEEIKIQKALGTWPKNNWYRKYRLNKVLIYKIVYELREKAWLEYTGKALY